jgi:Ca2+-binding RTX toxin-like protein
VASLTAGVAGPAVGVRGQPLPFVLSGAETGLPNSAVFKFKIDWDGNGTFDQVVAGPTGTPVTHVFPANGNNIVKVVAVDAAGNASPQAGVQKVVVQALALEADPADSTRLALFVGGTTGSDTILITPVTADGQSVNVAINRVVQPNGPFAPTGHILVYGQAGADVIQVGTATINKQTVKVAIPAVLLAGNRGSVLSAAGSRAANILVGNQGNDQLTGGSGRNLLIGGAGADRLTGGPGEDVLVGGTTSYDANMAALASLMAEWARTDLTYQQRIGDLTGQVAGGLNGARLLNESTVKDDAVVDRLFGLDGLDWLWGRSAEPVDRISGERLN